MYEYIEKMLEALPSNMEGLAKTPASSYIFNTDPGCKKAMQRTGAVVPSPSSQATISKQMYETGHTNYSSLPMH